MLHRCIEGEKVGVDGSKIVDVDRCHDPCPDGTPVPPEERGREPPPSSSSLAFPLDGRRVPPLVLGLHGVRGARAPPRLDLSLYLSLFLRFLDYALSPFLIYPEIRNSDWIETFVKIFFLKISFLAAKEEQ